MSSPERPVHLMIGLLEEMEEKFPNDADLGKVVRAFILDAIEMRKEYQEVSKEIQRLINEN